MKKKTETTKTTTDDDERCTTDENCCGGSDRRDRNINRLIAIPLSTDQNPDSLGEKEHILSSGGYVTPPPEPGLSSCVWLDRVHTQIGLAMSRSIGNHAVKDVGVIARPVITTRVIDWASDDFVIVATDGVWEFLSSEDAVDIVGGICTARPPMTTTTTARVADTMMIMPKEMRHVVVALAVAVGGQVRRARRSSRRPRRSGTSTRVIAEIILR